MRSAKTKAREFLSFVQQNGVNSGVEHAHHLTNEKHALSIKKSFGKYIAIRCNYFCMLFDDQSYIEFRSSCYDWKMAFKEMYFGSIGAHHVRVRSNYNADHSAEKGGES